MKVLATFDGSPFSESTLPRLKQLAEFPNTELVLVRVGEMPHGVRRDDADHLPSVATAAGTGGTTIIVEATAADYAETKDQAVERRRVEFEEYLQGIAATLPASATHRVAVVLGGNPAEAIIKLATAEEPDMIVMATHGHSGLSQLLFGHVAEQVVRSGVAPVLLVHPDAIKRAREAVGPV